MLPLFDDEACETRGHQWVKTTTQWPGETFERLTWTCSRCKEVRGRA
jgi:hypothetical protein